MQIEDNRYASPITFMESMIECEERRCTFGWRDYAGRMKEYETAKNVEAGLYIHWPFCERKCPYCDFNSVAGAIPHAAMEAALLAEWDQRRSALENTRLMSVYVGGGTPSLMQPATLERLLEAVAREHDLARAEITVEVNPSSALPDFLSAARSLGVNRLSIGIQSFSDEVLRFLGRVHDAQQAHVAIEAARAAGFDNLSLDLILASRPLGRAELEHDLAAIVHHRPEHVSAYLLGIETETAFGRRAAAGEILTRPDSEAVAQFKRVQDILQQEGYEHYEISNYARPDRRARHNGLYWSGAPYLGLGPGAHSYRPPGFDSLGKRSENIRDVAAYLERVGVGESPVGFAESLGPDTLARETIMTGLRRLYGITAWEFRERTGFDLSLRYGDVISKLVVDGLLVTEGTGADLTIRLAESAVLIADDVILAFF